MNSTSQRPWYRKLAAASFWVAAVIWLGVPFAFLYVVFINEYKPSRKQWWIILSIHGLVSICLVALILSSNCSWDQSKKYETESADIINENLKISNNLKSSLAKIGTHGESQEQIFDDFHRELALYQKELIRIRDRWYKLTPPANAQRLQEAGRQCLDFEVAVGELALAQNNMKSLHDIFHQTADEDQRLRQDFGDAYAQTFGSK